MVVIIFFLAFSAFFAQTQTYFVTSSGTDSSSCGAQATPCATIDQVLSNYPGATYTISVASGIYPTKAINLATGVTVTIQGTGNPTIAATSATGGLVWQDVTIALSGSGDFTVQSAATDATVVNNTVITLRSSIGNIFNITGGCLLLNNVTVDGANFDSYFIVDESAGAATNVSVIGSTFNNLTIGENGAILVFDAYGAGNILIDSSTFTSIQTGYVCIGFWAEDFNQTLTISNNVFNTTTTYLSSIYVENDNGLVVNVQNSSWNFAVAQFVCGALETLGPDNGVDHNITLNNLTFTNCNGPYAGALLVAYNSLNLSNSTFGNNRAEYGNDVVQGLDSVTSNMGESITNSCSTSPQPRAVVWDLSSGAVTDISNQLPDCATIQPVENIALSREKISAAPKFGRKQKKN